MVICNGSRSFPPRFSRYFPSSFSSWRRSRAIAARVERRRIWNALRAVVAFECPRPPLRDFTIEMGEKEAQSREPSGADESAGGFRSADFSGASPVASALGIRSGATPGGRSMPRSLAAGFAVHSNASVVASSSTASSTICALLAAASRKAVIASLLTFRGMPLVT